MTASCNAYSAPSTPYSLPILPPGDVLELKLSKHIHELQSAVEEAVSLVPIAPPAIDTTDTNFDALMLSTAKGTQNVIQALEHVVEVLQVLSQHAPPEVKQALEGLISKILNAITEIETQSAKTPTKNLLQPPQEKTEKMEKLRMHQNRHELSRHATSMYHIPRRG